MLENVLLLIVNWFFNFNFNVEATFIYLYSVILIYSPLDKQRRQEMLIFIPLRE